MKHYNSNPEKILKQIETFNKNRQVKVDEEFQKIMDLNLGEVLIYFVKFNIQNKQIGFIKPFKIKYHNYSKIIKERIMKEIDGENLLTKLRYFYFEEKYQCCKYCGKETKFISLSKGYKDFCNGYLCVNNWISKNKDLECWRESFSNTIKQRDSEYFREIYKKAHQTKIETGIEKQRLSNIRKTNEINGKWNKVEDKQYFEQYKRLVHIETENNYKLFKDIINPNNVKRTRKDIDIDGYHLDHIISKKYGFINGILPYVIGGVKNLQMLTISENGSKQDKINVSLLNDIVYSI